METPSPARVRSARLFLAVLVALSCSQACKLAQEAEPDGGRDQEDAGAPKTEGPTATEDSCRTQNVDLLFVIDNSGSMGQEQAKLARTVPELLSVLATGNRNGKRSLAGEPTDFAPAQTIHVGVISTDLAINGATSQNSCGNRSFAAADRDARLSVVRIDKPFGDDGALLTSTEVAQSGIWVPDASGEVAEVVAPDPSCADLELEQPYLTYAPGDLFEDTSAAFSCISKLGRNGCGLEQQLEAMLKALTPAESTRFTFSRETRGQGTAPGKNAGFLREDAALAVIVISDEEDCSIPDASRGLFDPATLTYAGGINVRCGLPDNQAALHGVERYVDGLLALKPARYRDRVIFASVVGVPLAEDTGSAVHIGAEASDELLARPDMTFSTRRNLPGTDDEPVPTCESPRGDGSAAPGRRFLQVAKGFGDNGLVSSICDDSYRPLITQISERIAPHMGDCKEAP